MTIPTLDSFSPRLVQLRAKRSALCVEISKRKAECAVIRERIQKGMIDPGNSQLIRAEKLVGEIA